jgi:molybdate transport system ATP-binding protein
MRIAIDIRKTLVDRGRRFALQAAFASSDDFVVLFGASGVGKSLTLQAIAGLLKPDSGVIRCGDRTLFDSERGIDLPIRQRRIGYLFQDYALFPHLSVAQNVGFALNRFWQLGPTRDDQQRVAEMLDVFELRQFAAAYPRDLSGGQRQRTALARALIKQPDLLLLDEPFAALNPILRAKMRAELTRIRDRFQVPVILITHDQEDVEAFAETLVMYEDGKVQGVWPFKRLRTQEAGTERETPMQAMLARAGILAPTAPML